MEQTGTLSAMVSSARCGMMQRLLPGRSGTSVYKILHPSNIIFAWNTIEPWLRLALDEMHADADLEQIKTDAQCGLNMVLLGYDPKTKELDLVLVAEPRRVSGVPTMVIMWAAGRNMHSWIKDIAVIENLAKERGFKQLHIWGRKGFERMLKAEGFRHEFTVIGKSLGYEVN